MSPSSTPPLAETSSAENRSSASGASSLFKRFSRIGSKSQPQSQAQTFSTDTLTQSKVNTISNGESGKKVSTKLDLNRMFGAASHSEGGAVASGENDSEPAQVWLDCDIGHDDAIALLLALSLPNINLLGISTMAGNAPNSATFANAGRCLSAFRAGESPSSKGYGVDFSPIPLFRGADSPILKVSKADPGIHGEDGLGGVVGLPSLDDPSVQRHLNYSNPSSSSNMIPASTLPEFLQHLSSLLRDRIAKGLPKIHLAVTGPCTNAAIFYKVYPQLFIDGIQQVVVMGGTTGRGNRGPLSEFNILVDPEAASIIYNSPVKTVQVGLDVTHQALFTPSLHDRLLKPGTSEASVPSSPINAQETSSTPSSPLSLARSLSSHPSNLRKMVSSTLTFFSQTYRKEFGFTKGPPIHDMLVIAFISDETIFYSSSNGNLIPPKRFRVDVECNEGLALGATVVDVYGDKETNRGWGRGGKNVEVLESVDTKRLWNLFFQAVDMCEEHIAAVEAAEESKQS